MHQSACRPVNSLLYLNSVVDLVLPSADAVSVLTLERASCFSILELFFKVYDYTLESFETDLAAQKASKGNEPAEEVTNQ